MNYRFTLAAWLLLSGPAAQAADRVVTITSYDRVRVDGPYRVEIVTGRGSSARISGDREAIDRVDISVQGQTLLIRTDHTGWQGGWPGDSQRGGKDGAGPILIRLTTGELKGASISGSGSMVIDRLRGARASLSIDGSGRMSVAAIDADRLDLRLNGSGSALLAGNARALFVNVRGAAAIEGGKLLANDLQLNSASSGNIALRAKASAKVTAAGAGEITILGRPACTVTALGSGAVRCGEGG